MIRVSGRDLSYVRTSNLPLFDEPPVVEVRMGLHIRPIEMKARHVAALYDNFATRYPIVEELPLAPIQVEQFGRVPESGVQFELSNRLPLPRLVFLSADRSSLVQIQDRQFCCFWRKAREGGDYPQYENLRADFLKNVVEYSEYISNSGIGSVQVVQAEIAYVNEISTERTARPDVLSYKLPSLKATPTESRLPESSATSISQHFTYRNKNGVDYARLHIAAEPRIAKSGPALRMSLAYRGEPSELSPSREPVVDLLLRFFDEGHDQIVRAFAANTTAEAHKAWRRVQ